MASECTAGELPTANGTCSWVRAPSATYVRGAALLALGLQQPTAEAAAGATWSAYGALEAAASHLTTAFAALEDGGRCCGC